MTFHIVTLFPQTFVSYLQESIIGRAIKEKKIKVKFYNPRDFVKPQNVAGYTTVDAKSYGGGPGMVLLAEPILKAVQKIKKQTKTASSKIIIFSPGGEKFTNNIGRSWVKKYEHLILICGRYEGVDARVKKILKAEEISVGDYVLTGGELPAMIVLDAMSRQVPGVLGKMESIEEGRAASSEVYTRPEILVWHKKRYQVPKVLLSGNHAKIEAWRAIHRGLDG